MRIIARLLLVGATFLSAAAPASSVVEVRPWLDVHTRLCLGTLVCEPLHEEISIARDGSAVASSASIPHFTQPWGGTRGQGKGSAAKLKQLAQAVATNQIGVQGGGCVVAENPNAYAGSYEITWYGANARWNDFVVYFERLPSGLPPCSTEVRSIIQAIETYSEAATGISVVH